MMSKKKTKEKTTQVVKGPRGGGNRLSVGRELADSESVTELINRLYATGRAKDSSGREIALESVISREEGEFLYGLVKADDSVRQTLEIGCAYGLSTLHIGEALRGRAGARHVMLDPFQRQDWHGIGLAHVREAGLDFCELIEEGSEFALPRMAQAAPGSLDFVFIDGWHTFDHTLVDAFYALRLLRVGGYLVVDDCDMPSVAKVASYLSKYPCLEIQARSMPPEPLSVRNVGKRVLGLPWLQPLLPAALAARGRVRRASMIAFRKIGEDERAWDWYAPF